MQSDATLASWVATKRTIGAAWLAPYRDQSAWWVAVILAQKLTLAFIFGFSRNRRLRAFFLVWLALASTSALLLVRPFRRSLHNGFEIVAWLLLLVIVNIFDSSSVEDFNPRIQPTSPQDKEVGSVYTLGAVDGAAAIFGLFRCRRAARAAAQLLAASGAGGGGGGAAAAARGLPCRDAWMAAASFTVAKCGWLRERNGGRQGAVEHARLPSVSTRAPSIARAPTRRRASRSACGSPLDRPRSPWGRSPKAPSTSSAGCASTATSARWWPPPPCCTAPMTTAYRSRRGSGEEERVPSLMKLASSSSLDYNTAL